MKTTLLLFVLTCTLSAQAQRPEPDKIDAESGAISIQPILHGALVLTWNEKTIYVDPYGGPKAFDGIALPDLILITDIHGDHLNPETLNAIETSKAKLIVPQAVADQLPENLKSKAVIINNGNRIMQDGISISAVPMYNLPEAPDSRHTKGRGN